MANNAKGLKVLDVGCGFYSRAKTLDFENEEVITLDIDPDMRPDVVGDARELPFDGGSFDAVLASHILEHFALVELQNTILEWRRVLKPGGELRIYVPSMGHIVKTIYEEEKIDWFTHAQIYGGQHDEWDFHKCGFFGPELRVALEAWGFDIKTLEDLTYPLARMEGGAIRGMVDAKELKCVAIKTKDWTPYRVMKEGKILQM